jgi:exosortase D (VPLPA-CTERM-specific)
MENNNSVTYVWKNPPLWWAVIGVAALLTSFAFLETIQDMVYRWENSDEYGYGYLIPLITLFLIWQRKNQLAETEFHPSIAGLFLIVFGGMIFFLGAIATTHTLSQYGLVITIMGIALSLIGWQAFKIVAVPLALLFFMVPLPPFIYNTLSTKLQLISSEIGVAFIRLFDISVYLEGNVIDLGAYKLQVVEACSGLRYLFPLASLSFIAAYIFHGELWKKAVIFLSSIPITVFMNSFRIGVIGVLVEYGGPGQAEGFLHYFEGWIIFMACISILVLEMAILAKVGKNKKSLADAFAIDFPESIPKEIERRPRQTKPVSWLVPVVVAGIAASSLYVQGRENYIPERRLFSEFPGSIGEWEGTTGRVEENILGSLKTEDYLLSDYAKSDNQIVNLWVAYYADQAAGSAAHSPRSCIPGGGWLIKDLSLRTIHTIQTNGVPLQINRLIIKKGEYTQVVYYWFKQRNRNVTNEWLVKWFLFWDGMTRNRTDGALVRLTTFVMPGDDISTADQLLTEFLNDVYQLLAEYIPD